MKEFAKHIITTKKGFANLFFVGQAGFILRSKTGKLLGIDLYLSDCVEKLEGHIGFKRLQPKLLEASDLKYDYLIATHPHYDHLDVDSAQELIFNCYRNFYASVNCEQEIKSIGIGASISKTNILNNLIAISSVKESKSPNIIIPTTVDKKNLYS